MYVLLCWLISVGSVCNYDISDSRQPFNSCGAAVILAKSFEIKQSLLWTAVETD